MSRLSFCFILLLLVVLGGCGPKGPTRHEINGNVKLHKEPIEEGVISFEPMDGQASMDGALIVNGVYHIPKDKGLFPGRYKVSIVAGDGYSGAGDASPDVPKRARSATKGKDRVPPQYNVKSTLIREVKPDETTFDFDIP